MAYINGGLVYPITFSMESDYVEKYHRYLLVQHRSRQFYYLMDRLLLICPDLQALFDHFRAIGNERMIKYVKGRITRAMLIRYMIFLMYPQQFAHRGDLLFYANWVVLQGFLQRFTRVSIECYGLPNKFYGFKLDKHKLFKTSGQWYDAMEPVARLKMIPHFHRLMERERID